MEGQQQQRVLRVIQVSNTNALFCRSRGPVCDKSLVV